MNSYELIILLISVLILLALGFYLSLFIKFKNFINKDKDRIDTFSNACIENLKEVMKEDSIESDHVDDLSLTGELVSRVETITIDEF